MNIPDTRVFSPKLSIYYYIIIEIVFGCKSTKIVLIKQKNSNLDELGFTPRWEHLYAFPVAKILLGYCDRSFVIY
jgi:hypothetical protein